MIKPDSTGLYHPTGESDVIELVQYALANKLQVRVRGAAQSATGAVYTDNFPSNINMQLDQMRQVLFNDSAMQVTVGAGCNLGFDPLDPSNTSKQDNSNNLFYQLNQKGWSIPNVTDAIHQTVGGFISTGSAAGTLQHTFDEAIVSVTIIDGTGQRKVYNKSTDPNDPFYAVGLSLGLFGVITSVTLQCVPAFNIIGQEAVTDITACAFDFFGSGSPTRPSLQSFLTTSEFSRIQWWPIQTLHRAVAWQARTMQASDYNNNTGTPQNFTPKPYQPIFPEVMGTRLPSETVASVGYSLIASWPDWFYVLMGVSPAEATPEQKTAVEFIGKLAPYLYPLFIDLYFPKNSPVKPPQQFWDTWLGSLPMDSFEFSNNLFNMSYAELWFPIDKAQQVVNIMDAFYKQGSYTATGCYTVEVFAAKQSSFWMNPGYRQDSFRINIMFFNHGSAPGANETYFSQFWNLFKQAGIDFRPHWGKNLPLPTSSTPAAYFKTLFPRWNDFMNLRTQLDPQNIFLTTYWKNQLGL